MAGPTRTSREVAAEAAHSLADICQSSRVLCEDLMPRLNSILPESAEFEDLLDDIAEEYRHIFYHIVNTRLFNYVVEGRGDAANAGDS